MKRNHARNLLVAALALLVVPMIGCPGPAPTGGGDDNTNENTGGGDTTNENDGGGDDGDPVVTLTPVKTAIAMHVQGGIEAGDDIIVYGTGGFAGVDYIVPSAGDTAGRGVPGGDTFNAIGFAVAGKKVAFMSNFVVTIFDAATETSNTIPETEIRLINTQEIGRMQSDGDFIVTRNDDGIVDDGKQLKVIDVSGDVPVVIAFDQNPAEFALGLSQVDIDAGTSTVVAVVFDTFMIYDLNDPAAAPLSITIDAGIDGDVQVRVDGRTIMFRDDEASGNVGLLDIDTGEVTFFTNNPAASSIALNGGSLIYFQNDTNEDSVGLHIRSAIGTVAGAPGSTLAPIEQWIDGSTTNNGVFGFAETAAITPDGGLLFIAGRESVGSGEYLQLSTGGAFGLFADPTGVDAWGCPAADVSVTSNTVAFKSGNNNDTTVAYIILD